MILDSTLPCRRFLCSRRGETNEARHNPLATTFVASTGRSVVRRPAPAHHDGARSCPAPPRGSLGRPASGHDTHPHPFHQSTMAERAGSVAASVGPCAAATRRRRRRRRCSYRAAPTCRAGGAGAGGRFLRVRLPRHRRRARAAAAAPDAGAGGAAGAAQVPAALRPLRLRALAAGRRVRRGVGGREGGKGARVGAQGARRTPLMALSAHARQSPVPRRRAPRRAATPRARRARRARRTHARALCMRHT
jgi:hypothetical protein